MIKQIDSVYKSKKSNIRVIYQESSEYSFYDNISDFLSGSDGGHEKNLDANKQKIIVRQKNTRWGDEKPSKRSTEFNNKVNNDLVGSISKKLHSLIKDHPFEDGQLSVVDHELSRILDAYGEDVVVKVLRDLWKLCYIAKNQIEHAHFLNCIRNISYYVDPDEFLTFAIAAIAHKDLLIREAGIATFESWDKEEHEFYLNSLADSGIKWLDDYKNEVMNLLGQ